MARKTAEQLKQTGVTAKQSADDARKHLTALHKALKSRKNHVNAERARSAVVKVDAILTDLDKLPDTANTKVVTE